MTLWIEHTQRFVTSGFKDRSAWDAALASCQNKQIREFLKDWPVNNEEAAHRADIVANSLEADKQEVPALMVRFLTYIPNFLALQSPLQIPNAQRESLFSIAHAFTVQIDGLRELLPSTGFLYFIRGRGLCELREYPAARTAFEKALDIYRQLVAEQPAAYLPKLATTLNSFGNLLRAVRDFPAARTAYEEALEITGQLAAEQPAAYLPNLAGTLNNLGILLSAVHDFPAARTAYEEAIEIRRQLAAEQPAAYLPDLATTLNNLGTLLREVCDFPAAHTAYEEALEIRRQLAAEQPAAYLPDLAGTLNNLGILLRAMHDFPAARTAYEEAIEIKRQLAAEQPAAYLPDLATTLNNLGLLLSTVRDFPAARTAYEEAIEIRRQLAAEQPAAYLPELAGTLNNLGNLLFAVRDFPTARTAYEKALEIRRQLAAEQPAAYLPDLAITLNNLGNLLSTVRDFPAARTAFEKVLDIYRQLAAEQPAAYLPDLATTLNNFGLLLSEVRDFPTARAAYVEARDIYRQLAAEQPAAYLPDLATTLNNLGNLLSTVRDFPAARTAFEKALDIYRQLAAEQPAAYLPDLATTLNSFGNLLRAVRDFPAARTAFEKALDIYRQLAAEQPAANLPDVAGTLNNLGTLLFAVHDFPAARTAFEKALDIYRQLAAEQPAAYLPDVAGILNNLGTLLFAVRDFSAAHKAYEEAVELAETMRRPDTLQHLAKYNVSGAYHFLLAEAVASCAIEKAFAYSVAMRDGQARSGAIGLSELQATQEWLKHQSEQDGILHRLLVASNGSEGELVLGLIDQEDCRFVSLQGEGWAALLPGDETTKNHETRRQLAGELWQSLPDTIQAALVPAQDSKQFIAISGDPFWSAFPWELLRFGENPEDYLGLHHALPRIGAIQAKDLQSQLALTELGQGDGRMTVLAPFDTRLRQLTGVVDEVESAMHAVEARGGSIVAFAKGSEASDLEIERQISLQPDVFYFSGHGTIVLEEELLVLHRDMSAQNALSSVSYFGKEHLMLLSEHRGCQLFSQRPLIVLNSCLTGRAREAGGAREDLISAFLSQGAGAVIATALPIYDEIGQALGEALFDPDIAQAGDIASAVVGTRKRLARDLCADVKSPFWGAWGMIHLHGSARATMPFSPLPGEQ